MTHARKCSKRLSYEDFGNDTGKKNEDIRKNLMLFTFKDMIEPLIRIGKVIRIVLITNKYILFGNFCAGL